MNYLPVRVKAAASLQCLNSLSTFLTSILLLVLCLVANSYGKVESNIIVKTWQASASEHIYCEVLEPQAVAYFYRLSPAKDFGTQFNFTFYSAKLVFSHPAHGCSQLSNAYQVGSRIVAIERGGCSFMTKVLVAQEAGALAVIVYDNDAESDVHVSMVDDGTHREVALPAMFMSGKDGHTIKHTLESLGYGYALVNLPMNLTTNQMYMMKQAPWNVW
ncbi:hypothetical protein BOX15_Mlig007367g2 [Macrostomum lignano]|uniref:PA domain-containing protein n=2 Tax=Macrostomum lignano TaxID=282301 RepID=A0A267ECB3_9PLAT|nr:hypothetical protein BOX15_Mlig007367g2 [Macrostomum lignano]